MTEPRQMKKIMVTYLVDGGMKNNTYYAEAFEIGPSDGIVCGTRITFKEGELRGKESDAYIEEVHIAHLELLTVLDIDEDELPVREEK